MKKKDIKIEYQQQAIKMKLKTNKISHCLLCKNKKFKKIFSLGNFFVSNFVSRKNIFKGIFPIFLGVYIKSRKIINYVKKIEFLQNKIIKISL